MKPAPFQYFAPTTIEQALTLLSEHDDAKILAGGQSLVPVMNFRLARPSVLVDLNRIDELFYIRERDQGVAIGAMTRQRTVERSPIIGRLAPLVAETMPFIAHPQIRNRGTFGGSLAHADPAAELPAVAVALDAKLKVIGRKSERWVQAKDFFTGLFSTTLQPDELLAEVLIPRTPPRTGWAFQETARRHGDFALAGAACTLTLDPAGKCANARLVLLSLGDRPIDAQGAVRPLIGETPNPQAIDAVAAGVDGEIDPQSDVHASAAFRRHLAKVLTRRVLESAAARALN